MESLIKKHFWVVNLLFLATAAWLIAGSINVVVAHKLLVMPALAKTGSQASHVRQAHLKRENNQVVVERNYFGSAMSIPVETVEREGPSLSEESARALLEQGGVESSIRASLIGTIVAEDPSWSMAMITDQTASETGIYRVQSRLMEEATVLAILTDRVVIERNGSPEYILMQEKAQPKNRMASTRPPPTKPGDASGEGIKKTGETTYTIERGEIEKTLSNLNSIAMQARIVPSFKNGEANGFKLFAIRPGSIYSKIGIQNGDIIHKINGYAINSPDKALEVYQKLKNARSIDLELTRRGKTKSYSYTIQ